MSIDSMLKTFSREGYCLWVGAGVTRHLAEGHPVPGWNELVQRMEARAGIPGTPEATLPERLDLCLEKLDRATFQTEIRDAIYNPTKQAIRELAKRSAATKAGIPDQLRQIAHLGTAANPIVNFNVETFTSRALAQPGGSFALKFYFPPSAQTQGLKAPKPFLEIDGSRHARMVYHPHGAIDHSGLCVLTQCEYEEHEGTLAYQLAVHSAFQSNLAIVGMSLGDRYLREHLAKFRDQILEVVWFVDGMPDPATVAWAENSRIKIICQPRPEIWEGFLRLLPSPNEHALQSTWVALIISSFLPAAPTHGIAERLAMAHGGHYNVDDLRQLAGLRGETGSPTTDDNTFVELIQTLDKIRVAF